MRSFAAIEAARWSMWSRRRCLPSPASLLVYCTFAIANTGLLNYIMGSRLLYGMARQGFVPKFSAKCTQAAYTHITPSWC
jgi:amino acid transporter